MHIVVQYEDRDTAEFKSLIQKNKEYCKQFDIQYLFLHRGYEHLPPWWRKVALVHELLPHYESVFWVDSDAAFVFLDHCKELFRSYHFVFSPNPPMLEHLEMLSAPMCAGVWGVRNTPEGRAIMDHWFSAYNARAWSKRTKWTAGTYAGTDYEQGAFEVNIYRVQDFQKWIFSYPWYTLNYMPKDDHKVWGNCCPVPAAVHDWSGNRKHIFKHWPLREEAESP